MSNYGSTTLPRGPDAYRDFLHRTAKRGSWFVKPRASIRLLGSAKSDMVLYLANLGQASADSQGWFLCVPRFVFKGLGMSAARQDRLLAQLEKLRLVEVQDRQGRRFLRVNVARLSASIRRAMFDES